MIQFCVSQKLRDFWTFNIEFADSNSNKKSDRETLKLSHWNIQNLKLRLRNNFTRKVTQTIFSKKLTEREAYKHT